MTILGFKKVFPAQRRAAALESREAAAVAVPKLNRKAQAPLKD